MFGYVEVRRYTVLEIARGCRNLVAMKVVTACQPGCSGRCPKREVGGRQKLSAGFQRNGMVPRTINALIRVRTTRMVPPVRESSLAASAAKLRICREPLNCSFLSEIYRFRMIRKISVLIVGGGASGALLGSAFVRAFDDMDVTIIEPRQRLGTGMAYSTTCPLHLLNVPAGKMSALPGEPNHFIEWLAARGYEQYDGRAFVPRSMYGEYLAEFSADAQRQNPGRFRHARETAVTASTEHSGVRVECASGELLRGDFLVLAFGNAAPAAWPNVSDAARSSGRFFASAWDPGALIPSDPDEVVLLLGTGLTAVDAVLGLRYNGHRGSIHMVSRRGLLPHEHRLFDAPPAACPDAKTVAEFLSKVRGSARETKAAFDNWRVAIDGVRPKSNELWQAFTLADQRRFARHVMPYWNVHRHRMAPEAAKALAELLAAGSLQMLAGRTENVTAGAKTVTVSIRRRGSVERSLIEAGRVINCSGPEHDFEKLPNPLVQNLLANGSIAAHPLGIGLQVARHGAMIANDGTASARLFAIGPVRYGTLIETTAIPEIRLQVEELTELLAHRTSDTPHGTTARGESFG